MKNQKGFTLIELLAVIVILAIIALIATPMILGVIDKARKGAAESSALGYIDAVEKEAVIGMLDNEAGNGNLSIPAGVYDTSSANLAKVSVKGQAPESGWVAINSEGTVVAASLKFASYNKHIGYTEADQAKGTLDAMITKPVQAEGQKVEDFVKAAIDAVRNALHPSA